MDEYMLGKCICGDKVNKIYTENNAESVYVKGELHKTELMIIQKWLSVLKNPATMSDIKFEIAYSEKGNIWVCTRTVTDRFNDVATIKGLGETPFDAFMSNSHIVSKLQDKYKG